MKKTILVTCMSLFFAFANGQVKWDTRVGVNVSGFSQGHTEVRTGFKAGAGIEYAFSELFALRPSLFYSMKGAAANGHKFSMNHRYVSTQSYLELPVLASFRFGITDGFTLAANAGPYAACRLGKKEKADDKTIRSFDAGIEAGLDFIIHRFVAGVSAQYGLIPLTDGSDAPRNICYSLTVGRRF